MYEQKVLYLLSWRQRQSKQTIDTVTDTKTPEEKQHEAKQFEAGKYLAGETQFHSCYRVIVNKFNKALCTMHYQLSAAPLREPSKAYILYMYMLMDTGIDNWCVMDYQGLGIHL